MTSFHANTFRILGRVLRPSATAISEVERAEARLGFQLPASVREWYCYDEAVEILRKHSNDDHPLSLDKFGVVEWTSHQLLPFQFENQGVCIWSIMLDGSDDPPVYVDVDTGGTEWHLLAPTFSAFVYSRVWDYKVVMNQPGLAAAQNEPLSASAIAELEKAFVSQPRTYGWPGSIQYRFAGSGHAILIWSAIDQADWWIGGQDEVSLESALRLVWTCDDVGKSFYECTEIAKLALARIHNKK